MPTLLPPKGGELLAALGSQLPGVTPVKCADYGSGGAAAANQVSSRPLERIVTDVAALASV